MSKMLSQILTLTVVMTQSCRKTVLAVNVIELRKLKKNDWLHAV